MDYLLRGLKEIHEEIFRGKDGKPVIPFQRFCKEDVKNMRKKGVLFTRVIGVIPNRRRYLCGWRNVIINYYTALGRRTEEENEEG